MKRTLKIATVSICSFILSSCLPLAFIAGATIGGAVIYDKRSVKTIATDHNIAQHIRQKINSDPDFKGSYIDITSFNGIVLLVGQVAGDDLKDKANQIAMDEPKVRRVYNQLQIGAPPSGWQRSKDSGISALTKSALLAARGLRSSQIKVLTENGVVYLLGVVTPEQAKIAATAASTVSGVRKVVKVFEYVR